MGEREKAAWILVIMACMALVVMIIVFTGDTKIINDLKDDLAFCESSKAMLKGDTDELVKHVEGLTPALEACEADREFVDFLLTSSNVAASLRVTTGYELLNALTLTIGDGDSVIRYQKILDNIELIADPTLDNMMDGWMLNADEDESMLMLLEIIKYLLIDAEFYLLPRQ